MSKRFTPQHKLAVLALLDANGGSVSVTAAQCGISERTIYAWKKERAQLQRHAHDLQQSPPLLQQADEMQEEDEISLLRTYVMQSAMRIAAGLSRELESPVLFHKVNALNGLLDRLAKIEKAYPSAEGTEILQIEFVDRDGSIHPTPFWQREASDEDDE